MLCFAVAAGGIADRKPPGFGDVRALECLGCAGSGQASAPAARQLERKTKGGRPASGPRVYYSD